MYCTSCGNEIDEGDKFCSFCGALQPGFEAAEEPESSPAAAPVMKAPAEEASGMQSAAVKTEAAPAGTIPQMQSAAHAKRSGRKTGLIAAILAIIVIAALIILIKPGKSSGTSAGNNNAAGSNSAVSGESGNSGNSANANASGNSANAGDSGNTANAGNTGNNTNAADSGDSENSGNNSNAAGNGNTGNNSDESGDGNSGENSNAGGSGNTAENTEPGKTDNREEQGNYLFKTDNFLVGMDKPQGAEDYIGLIVGKDGVIKKLPHQIVFKTFSADGSRGFVYCGSDVYRIESGKDPEISDITQVYSVLSSDGGTVLYTDKHQEEKEKYGAGDPEISLNIRKFDDDSKIENIDKGYYFKSFAISPSGKAVAYTVRCTDQSLVTRLYVNGKSTELPFVMDNITAVTDDGRLIYYLSDDYNTLYVYSDGRSTEIVTSSDMYSLYSLPRYYNCDNTQMLLMYKDSVYLVDNGKTVKVDTGLPGIVNIIMPYNFQTYLRTEDSADIFYGIRSFKGCYLMNAKDSVTGVYYLDEACKVHSVCENASQFGLATDGRTLYYSAHGDLFAAVFNGSEIVSETLVETSASVFQMTPDGKTLYYVLEGINDLYVMKQGEKPRLIAGNVTSLEPIFSDPCMCIAQGNKLYYVSNGAVFCAEGDKVSEIKGLEGIPGFINCNAYSAIISSHTENYENSYTYVLINGKMSPFRMY